MNENYVQFRKECADEVRLQAADDKLRQLSGEWIIAANQHKYSYHYELMGRPIIQYPQDIVAMQELIWKTKPDLIIETGIAHGGSLVLSASMLAILDLCEAIETGGIINPSLSRRKVLGVDIDIRAHNRAAIEAHPMASRIQMIQGSSIAPEIIGEVHSVAANYRRVLVILDSNHTHEHVLAELAAYAPLASLGSYCVVMDTVVEELPEELFPDRPWGPGNNPKTAVREYLETHAEFEIDEAIDNKLLISVAPEGYLKRIR